MTLNQSNFTQITAPGDPLRTTNSARSIDSVLAARPASSPEGSEPSDSNDPAVLGLYVHVPFCFHKCHYCDFYSIVDSRDRQAAFTDRLIEEIRAAAPLLPTRDGRARPIETIFVGGGTPTLLQPHLWGRLIDAITGHLPLATDLEWTVEANPETVTAELLEILKSGGVNRLSIGAQTFNPRLLTALERWHDPANVRRSVTLARRAGFSSINLDLIFAIADEAGGQTLAEWAADLDAALELEPDHLSCYGLTYEPNTALTQRLRLGRIAPVDEEIEAEMYEHTMARLHEAGYEHYEVSAWARPGKQCRHNLVYWRNHDWWPLGPSASGHIDGLRWKNVPRLGEYLDHGPLPRVQDVEDLDGSTRTGEHLMLELRLREGMPRNRLARLLERDPDRAARERAIDELVSRGLLARDERSIRLSRSGLMIADVVLAELIVLR